MLAKYVFYVYRCDFLVTYTKILQKMNKKLQFGYVQMKSFSV